MRISIFTDELSSDIDTALELAREMQFDAVDLRGVDSGRYPNVSPLMRVHVPSLLREYGFDVISVSPGLFKIPYPSPLPREAWALRWDHAMSFDDFKSASDAFDRQLENVLPSVIEAAVEVGAQAINCFSFDRAGAPSDATPPPGVIQALQTAARMAGQASLRLLIENEATCWASTAASAAALIDAIDEPALGLTWDPANAFKAGDDEPFPSGYELIRHHVQHVHFKDARLDSSSGARIFAFDGIVDWPGQIAALARDGYRGAITIETHQRPKVATSKRYLDRLRSLIADSASRPI